MQIILLIINILAQSIQQVSRKAYNTKSSSGVYTFSSVSVFVALMFFIIIPGDKRGLTFEIFLYSIGYAVTYVTATITTMLAIRTTAPLSLTSLILSCSLIIPTIYGLAVLDEPFGITLAIGIVMLFASLILINFENSNEPKKLTAKWGIYIFLTFISNGICNVIIKTYQLNSEGQHINIFMITGLSMVLTTLILLTLIKERKQLKENLPRCLTWGSICGTGNGLANFLALLLSISMPASLLFPLLSSGGIIVTSLVSVFIYKEKLSLYQKLGFLFGLIAIISFNI